MADNEVILRGFDMPVADIDDQLHFRQPLLSFHGSPTLYLAGRVDWHSDRQGLLTVVDDPDDRELATLLDDGVGLHMASGQGVIVAGARFFHAASRVGDLLDGFSHQSAADCECWIRMAKPAEYIALERKLIDESRAVFDQELGKTRRQGRPLMERGNAAMLVLRSCGPIRQDDLAIRQLAAARQNGDFDLYRRLLTRFEHELGEPEDQLDEQARRHMELAADTPIERTWPGRMLDTDFEHMSLNRAFPPKGDVGPLVVDRPPSSWPSDDRAVLRILPTEESEGKYTSATLLHWGKTISASKAVTKDWREAMWG